MLPKSHDSVPRRLLRSRQLGGSGGLGKYVADLTVVYVIPQAIFHTDWAADVEDTSDIPDITEEAQIALANMTAPYRQGGLSITEHVLSGGPYVEIVRMAQRVKADLIVMGAHGVAGVKPTLTAVAEKVMAGTCSVMTVRETWCRRHECWTYRVARGGKGRTHRHGIGSVAAALPRSGRLIPIPPRLQMRETISLVF